MPSIFLIPKITKYVLTNKRFHLKDIIFYFSFYILVILLILWLRNIILSGLRGIYVHAGILDFIFLAMVSVLTLKFRSKFILPYLKEFGSNKEILQEKKIEKAYEYGREAYLSGAKSMWLTLVLFLITLVIIIVLIMTNVLNITILKNIPSGLWVIISLLLFLGIIILVYKQYMSDQRLREKYFTGKKLTLNTALIVLYGLLFIGFIIYYFSKILILLF